MKKRLLKIAGLTTIMSMALAVPTFAANSVTEIKETQTVTGAESATCEVTMECDSDYTVTLPKTVTLSGSTKSGEFNFTLSGDIAGNEYISVTPADFQMTASGKPSVTATVSTSKSKFRTNATTKTLGADEAKMSTGGKITISAPELTAGHWEGTMTVNVGVETDS